MRSKLRWNQDGFSCSTSGWPAWTYRLIRLLGRDPLKTRRPKVLTKEICIGMPFANEPFITQQICVNGFYVNNERLHRTICLMIGVEHERSLVYQGQPAFYTTDDRYARDIIRYTWVRRPNLDDYGSGGPRINYSQKLEYLQVIEYDQKL